MRAAQAGADREAVTAEVTNHAKPIIDRIANLRKLEAAAVAAPEPEPAPPTYQEVLAPAEPVVPKVRTQPTPLDITSELDERAHQAATSPLNPKPPPTPEQIEAENYEAGRVKGADIGMRSLDFAIEYPRGTERGGITMQSHYGRIPGVLGGDGMSLDFFMGNADSDTVYLYHHIDKEGRFTQHKPFIGFESEAAVRKELAHFYRDFERNPKARDAPLVALSKAEFEQWAASGKTGAPHPRANFTAPRQIEGQPTRAVTAAGEAVNAKYELVEVGDLISSHTLTGRANSHFPQELQPRDRTRAGLRQWIIETASRFEPALAVEGASAAEGAPIIGPDNVIESGNGRTMVITKLYLDKSTKYRDYLKANAQKFGFTPEQVDQLSQPVLVRRRTDPMDMPARTRFAAEANRPNISTFSATEQANSDARTLTVDEIGTFNPGADGNVLADSNRTFVQAFIGKLPATERAGLLTAEGAPTRQLANRIQAAVFSSAYQDDRLLTLMAEEANPDVRNVIAALTAAAPAFARARAAGTLEQADVVAPLIGAIEVVRQARAKGQSTAEYLDQRGLFGDTSPEVNRMARFIDTNIRSARKMGEAFTAMASFLETEGARRQSGSLFGEEPTLDVNLAMQAANQRMQAQYGGGGQAGLFSRPQYAQREPGETDKQYAKRAIDPGPAPESLPYAPDRMFERYPGAVLLPLEALVLTKSVTAGEQGRNVSPKRMLAAYHGALPRRPPISVRALPGGKYEIVDGNGTVAALRDLGWPAVPALVENAREKKRALIGSQAGWSEAEIYQHALPNQAALARAGQEIAQALGVDFSNPGIKSQKRLREKVELEGYVGPDQVADVVRGGFLADSAAQSEAIVEQLAQRFEIHDKGIVVTDTGFVDRKILVKFENGQVGEVQVVPRALDPLARGPGADLYKQQRALLVDKAVPDSSVPLYEQLTRAQIDLYAPAVASMPGWAPVALAGASPEVSQALKSRKNSDSESRSPLVSAAAASTGRQGLPGEEMTNATMPPDSLSPVTSGRSSSAPSSRTDLTGKSTTESITRVRGWIEPELKALESIIQVEVVADTSELPDPSAPPDVEGAYTQDGRVWFVASNLPTAARAREVARHEVFGHMAIERNGKFKVRLEAIQRAIKAGNLKPLVRDVRARQGLLPALVEAREVVALMAERGINSPLLGGMRTALRDVSRDLGLDMPIDEAELTALVATAAGDLRRDADMVRDFRAAQGLVAVRALEKADPTDAEILAAIDAIYESASETEENDYIDGHRRALSGKLLPTDEERRVASMYQRAAPIPAEELNEIIAEHGQPIVSRVDAERRYGDDLIFTFNEMDEAPSEVTSVEMLRSHTVERLVAVPRAVFAMYSRPPAARGKIADVQDFGDLTLTEQVQVEGEETLVEVSQSAQQLFEQARNRVKHLEALSKCLAS